MSEPEICADPSSDADEHFLLSTYREKIIEHRFVSEVLAALWHQGIKDAEVLKPEVDGGGYDVVFQAGGTIRHVQLKSVKANATTAKWKVALRLASYPSGCVVVIVSDPHSLAIGPFLWFGGEPGYPLPTIDHFKVAKHTKANAEGVKGERPKHRELPRSAFRPLAAIGEVAKVLFDTGEASASAFSSPLNNAGVEDMLRRAGHPYVQVSWQGGLFDAVGHPGVKVCDADYAHRGDYGTVLLGIAKQAGVSAKVHDSGGGLPPVILANTDEPTAALRFIDLCHLYQIAVLPLASAAFAPAPSC
jgi:hypothetical protein